MNNIKKPNILYYSSINYDFIMQRPQQLFKEWSNNLDFNFYYVEPPQSIIKKYTNAPANINNLIRPNTFSSNMFLNNALITALNKSLITLSLHDITLPNSIAIVATCLWEPYITKSNHALICYDYMDDINIYPSNEPGIKKRHNRLLEKSDLVFVTADKLHEEVAFSGNKNIVDISNGVDYYFFKNSTQKVCLEESTRKKVGYVGALYKWIDMDIIISVANKLPDVDFVLVGPISDENEHYLKSNYCNIHFTGKVPYDLVPAYIDLFDVAIIPFKSGSIAESTDPIKLYEYFSLGKPVVSTKMRQLDKYNNGELMICTNDASEFAKSISYFLSNDNSANKEERIKISMANSWAAKAQIMLDSISSFVELLHK